MAVGITAANIVRPDLAGHLAEISTASRGFVGLMAMPKLEVEFSRYEFVKLPREAWLKRGTNIKRGLHGDTAEGNFDLERDTIDMVEYTFAVPTAPRQTSDLARYIDVEATAAKFAAMKVLEELEFDISAVMFNSTTFPVATAGKDIVAAPWNNDTTGKPIDNYNEVRDEIRLASGGATPNFTLMNSSVKNVLARNAQILACFKGATLDVVGAVLKGPQLASILDLEEFIEAKAAYDSANEGITAVGANVWSSGYVFTGRKSTQDPTIDPQFGRVYMVMPTENGGTPLGTETVDGVPIVIDEYWDAKKKTKFIRATLLANPKVLNAELGGLFLSPLG